MAKSKAIDVFACISDEVEELLEVTHGKLDAVVIKQIW